MNSYPATIDEYWQMHGYSEAEAKAIERQQIAEAVAVQEADDNHEQVFNCCDQP